VNGIVVHGLGAVSPAGWGVAALRDALAAGAPLPTQPIARPGWQRPLHICPAPPPPSRPPFLAHARLRRAGVMSQHIVAAALEALGGDTARVQSGALRLGIVVCMMAGCVTYSRRFFEETLQNPVTASPLLFPETVFNAPASHLAALLNSTAANYTLVGDEGVLLQGLAVAADWLAQDQAEACIIVGAEELDWIVADALRLFQRGAVHSDGAGALYLKRGAPESGRGVELARVTDSFPFTAVQSRHDAAEAMRAQLSASAAGELLYCSALPGTASHAAEQSAWRDWSAPHRAPKTILGEAFAASAAWQCVLACDAIQRGEFAAANVSVVGTNEQAIGTRFVLRESEHHP